MVLQWNDRLKTFMEKAQIRFMDTVVIELKFKSFTCYEDCILYLNHVAAPGLYSLLRTKLHLVEEKELKEEEPRSLETIEEEIKDDRE